ncbi:hypothetical protein DSO57_1023225 [Entomophthora muscae]|uniref:Uncharacterized protein n=2 Tax=Entomophthora muscae TaxID=34485 RepID=A0ACC2SV37_9FUNG|nr:hypothetical protein DSO57_1012535 [Entomophthora muscae]KAJ9084559.1 hypothetical protein DSO57_1023225 [Entomophthora muscae]
MANQMMDGKRNCVQACDYCKLKKRKCVKEGVRCTYCEANNQDCTYHNLNRKRGRMGERKKKKGKKELFGYDMMPYMGASSQPSSPLGVLFDSSTPVDPYVVLAYEDMIKQYATQEFPIGDLLPYLEAFHNVPHPIITAAISREELSCVASSSPTPTSMLLLYSVAAVAGICCDSVDRAIGIEWYFLAVDQLSQLDHIDQSNPLSHHQFNLAAYLLDFIKIA